MDKPVNPPAFPLLYGERDLGHNEGMTLRDWFAGQAMSGYLAGRHPDYRPSWGEVAEEAYEYADAMLAQREAGQ